MSEIRLRPSDEQLLRKIASFGDAGMNAYASVDSAAMLLRLHTLAECAHGNRGALRIRVTAAGRRWLERRDKEPS